jgi:hypothetical protein
MNFKQNLIAFTIFSNIAMVTACGGGAEKSTSAVRPNSPASQPTIDTQVESIASNLVKLTQPDLTHLSQDTPDTAIKSWWEIIDAQEKFHLAICQLNEKTYKSWQEGVFAKAVTPEARERFGHRTTCSLDSYKRTIDEVKNESETRAIVYATVWTTTAPPENTAKDELQEAKRGTKFRYVLEKLAGKWLISDMYRFKPKTSYSAEEWDRVYTGNNSKFFSGTVYHQ